MKRKYKENMDNFLDQMGAFDNGTYYDVFR